MNERQNRNVVTEFQCLETCEIKDGDNSIFVSEAINGFVRRSAKFLEIEERNRKIGLTHHSPVIEA